MKASVCKIAQAKTKDDVPCRGRSLGWKNKRNTWVSNKEIFRLKANFGIKLTFQQAMFDISAL